MSYKEKPIIKLYKYENNSFVMQAQIDDFQEVSFEHNIYEAGTFTITINYNIPNALLFQRGLFVQFGNNPYDFGEIITIQDAIGQDGKGSQIRTITGKDARYILKRRVIKNMNSNGLWAMTDKGEIVLRNLIKDQCGSSAETKRQLPISNTIPASADAKGKEYSASENFSNLYEVCKTIATQSEIGWRMSFDGTSLSLEVFSGQDLSQTVRFDTNYESLANGEFSDSSESYSNAIYIGGKGQNDDRDIYEGEDGTPEGFDRFESWDNQSSLTVESEYEAEALSMLTQYGQTLTMSGNGLAKCPYVFREQYDIGDTVTVAFSGKSAKAQILSITEHWTWGSYDISFAFGKPQNNLADQLQLMLRKIQEASNKTNSTDSVRWYTIPTDTAMPKADVTYNTIGFVGTVGTGATFTLYLDNEKTGAKTYHVYFKQLGGTGKLTLTTGKAGATNLTLNAGTYVAIIYVDENGNITNTASTPTSTIEAGSTQPATSGGVYQELKERGIIVAGVIRNSGNGWGLIGGGHEAINIDSVTTDNGNIVINYANIGNCNVVTFLATPDETFAGQNIYMGASVASDKATISIYQRQTATLKIVYNGNGFDVTVISADFTPNITVTKLDDTKINISGFLSRIVSITPIYESVSKMNIYGVRESGLTSSNMYIYVHCIDGQSVIDTSCRFLISIEATKKIDADTLVSEWGNIWLYGLMKKI